MDTLVECVGRVSRGRGVIGRDGNQDIVMVADFSCGFPYAGIGCGVVLYCRGIYLPMCTI